MPPPHVTLKDQPTVRADIPSRIAAVEVSVDSLGKQFHELSTDVHSLQTRIENGFENVRATIFASRQTPWTVLVSAGGLILTLAILVMTTLGGIRGEVSARFSEVETQFRGVTKEINTQIDNNTRVATQLRHDIEKVEDSLNGVNGQPGLKERLAKSEQQLADHDKYLWPVQQEQAKQQADLANEIGKHHAAIEGLKDFLRHQQEEQIHDNTNRTKGSHRAAGEGEE